MTTSTPGTTNDGMIAAVVLRWVEQGNNIIESQTDDVNGADDVNGKITSKFDLAVCVEMVVSCSKFISRWKIETNMLVYTV